MIPSQQKLLFIGDSITDAYRRPDEINDAFQLGNGYAFLIAAQLRATRPGDDIVCLNRGLSGCGLKELNGRWESDCLALEPTILSLLVGVNETIRRFNGEAWLSYCEFETRYAAILERTRREHPQLHLVLCEPFLLRCGHVDAGWDQDIRARASLVQALASQYGSIFVPLQSVFDRAIQLAPPEHWAYDGIHPTAAGFYLIAQTWLKAVESSMRQKQTSLLSPVLGVAVGDHILC